MQFYCFQCGESTEYIEEEINFMRKLFVENGMIWWKCPHCGVKIYFEDVLKSSDGCLFHDYDEEENRYG